MNCFALSGDDYFPWKKEYFSGISFKFGNILFVDYKITYLTISIHHISYERLKLCCIMSSREGYNKVKVCWVWKSFLTFTIWNIILKGRGYLNESSPHFPGATTLKFQRNLNCFPAWLHCVYEVIINVRPFT